MLIQNADRIFLGATEIDRAYLGSTKVWEKPGALLTSSNLTSANGLTVGTSVTKDMRISTTSWTTSAANLPGSTSFSSIRAFWPDWGDDIWDNWGYFYIYNPSTGNYLAPVFTELNGADGVIATETFSLDGRTFTIKHGYPVTGIYKIDVSVNDFQPFAFGSDGGLGSNGTTTNQDLTASRNIDGQNITLFYNYNYQGQNPSERFYTYWVPYVVDEGTSKTYTDNVYDTDFLAIYSNEVTRGITVYIAKQNDVVDWVAADLSIA